MNHEDWNREELFTNPEELVTFAQAYYATEFPNDARRDCPPTGEVGEAARSGALPDGRLRSHLFSCSECFCSYRSARMSRRAQTAAAPRLKSPWTMVAAAICCLLFLGLIAMALLRPSRTGAPAVTVSYVRQGSAPTALPEVPEGVAASHVPETGKVQPKAERKSLKTSPRVSRMAARNTLPRPTLPVVYVDLKEGDLLRGADESSAARHIITLSPERQRLRLRMPRGSAAGRYTVRIVDAYGKSLLTAAARSSGRTLSVELDLRGLTTKLYRLCLSRDGEAPDCYLLSVAGNAPTH